MESFWYWLTEFVLENGHSMSVIDIVTYFELHNVFFFTRTPFFCVIIISYKCILHCDLTHNVAVQA